MPTTAELEVPDTTSGVLTSLRNDQATIDLAEIRKLQLTVSWAAMHSADTLVGPATEWSERALPLGGPGAPEVAEFCVPELALALGMSHDAASGYLADAIDLAHRLPAVYKRVLAGEVAVWRARKIAQLTRNLSLEAAGFVDHHLAPFVHNAKWSVIDRLVTEALVRFDPDAAELRRLDAAEHRRFDVLLADAASRCHDGTVEVTGMLDLADARDLEAAVQQGAAELAALGSVESLDVRRSQAVGVLARRDLTLDLTTEQPIKTVKQRQVVIHVHLDQAAVLGTARVEGHGLVSVDQVLDWCQITGTKVRVTPVIDLNSAKTVPSYDIPDRMHEQVILRDPTCVFPLCGVTSRRCDLDHIEPWSPDDTGGSTTPPNLAPLCRRHHRLKTHGGWTYHRLPDGQYHWVSPHTRRQP